jgi:hypothetical protein
LDRYSYPSLAGMLSAPVESRNDCELMLYIMDFHCESKFTLVETLVSNGAVHLGVDTKGKMNTYIGSALVKFVIIVVDNSKASKDLSHLQIMLDFTFV